MSFVGTVRTTLGGILVESLAASPARRAAQLGLESIAYTVFAVGFLAAIGMQEAGLISIFLVAAPLSDRLMQLLEENREAIWTHGMSGWRANRRTAAGVLWIFLGVLFGYAAIASWLGGTGDVSLFEFALVAANVGTESLQDRVFGNTWELLAHNLTVALAVACLAFVYRGYGVMLALAWNACVWACVLSVLALRGDSPGLLVAALAVLPHLILEAGGYILVALAAIFSSKALSSYDLGEGRQLRALRASFVLLLLAAATLLAGAWIEANVPALVLSTSS